MSRAARAHAAQESIEATGVPCHGPGRRRIASVRARLAVLALALLGAGCGGDATPVATASGDPPRSVLLVVLDAARADHLSGYGYARPTTPEIDAFARGAIRYETAISEAPFTFLATSALFTGGSPAVTGLVGRTGGRIPDSLELITETARDAGFATFGYSENPYITRYFGFHQGFDVFEEAFPVELHVRGGELAPDFDSAAHLDRILARATADPSRPFFLYVHLLRPHTPYAPPPPFAGRFGSDASRRSVGDSRAVVALDEGARPLDPSTLAQLRDLYDENLAYADALFGRLLDGLEASGRGADTVVVLTSDHGEAFDEHGRLLHSTQLYDPMLRIPLIVRVPGEGARVERAPVQLADLGRGLAAFFASPEALSGLVDLGRERSPEAPLFSWTNARTHLVSARTPSRKLVMDAQSLEVVAYHDLVADPAEQRPIALDAEGRALVPRLRRRIAEWTGQPERIESDTALSPRKRRELEALGYLEAGADD